MKKHTRSPLQAVWPEGAYRKFFKICTINEIPLLAAPPPYYFALKGQITLRNTRMNEKEATINRALDGSMYPG